MEKRGINIAVPYASYHHSISTVFSSGGLGGLGGLFGKIGIGYLISISLPTYYSSNALGGLMNNPEMKKAMENPKVLQAVMELMQNPAAFSKYQNDPEVMNAFSSLMGSMGGGAGVRPPPQA